MHAQGQAMAGKARVNTILPGWIDTVDEGGYVPAKEDNEWHPVGRVGEL